MIICNENLCQKETKGVNSFATLSFTLSAKTILFQMFRDVIGSPVNYGLIYGQKEKKYLVTGYCKETAQRTDIPVDIAKIDQRFKG